MVVAPLVFTLGTRWRFTLFLGKEPPVSIGQDVGWTPETSLDIMGKNLLPCQESKHNSSVTNSVA